MLVQLDFVGLFAFARSPRLRSRAAPLCDRLAALPRHFGGLAARATTPDRTHGR